MSLACGNDLCTVTPTASSINGQSAGTPWYIQNQVCRFTSDNRNWFTDCWDNNSQHPVTLDTGAANAYVATCAGVAAPFQPGDTCRLQVANANTTASTINVSGGGIKNLTRVGGGALQNADLLGSPASYEIDYDGTEWAVPAPSGGSVAVLPTSTSLFGVGYTGTATNQSVNAVTGIPNPLHSNLLTGGSYSDRGSPLKKEHQGNTFAADALKCGNRLCAY